jgi:hypothetical protein
MIVRSSIKILIFPRMDYGYGSVSNPRSHCEMMRKNCPVLEHQDCIEEDI